MTDREKALLCLDRIPCSGLHFHDWLKVGIALKASGCSAEDWDSWFRSDPKRYNPGECATRWASFNRGDAGGISLATLIYLAKQSGGTFPTGFFGEAIEAGEDRALDWDAPLRRAPEPERSSKRRAAPEEKPLPEIVNPRDLPRNPIPAPASDWREGDLLRYLASIFEPDEYVGIVTDCSELEKGGRKISVPRRGFFDRTAAQLSEAIREARGDLGSVIGDPDPEVGAWIRINPLDGKGVSDANCTAFRHCLLEADEGDLEVQLATIRELELPLSCIVHSGGKSLHALVRIEAANANEYRERVDFLFRLAERNGLHPDPANRNPSRLSRLPGVERKGKPQYIVEGRRGKRSWEEWREWIEDLKDDLPDPEEIPARISLPPLAPELIEGVLRVGHKLLLTGPSKAAKSFALIQLAVAVANGGRWFGMNCRKGKPLYINLELDPISAFHRFHAVTEALGIGEGGLRGVDVWNLRGFSVPLDRLASKLIRRAASKGYDLIILDPIYKVLTGDENSAEDMARFCSLFDRISRALGCAIANCHHHSKGIQGGKRSLDRASGSGVFGRDPDAALDLIELRLSPEALDQIRSRKIRAILERLGWDPPEDLFDWIALLEAGQSARPDLAEAMRASAELALTAVSGGSGWRIEATLREFKRPDHASAWFEYPIHKADYGDILAGAKAEGEDPPWAEERKRRADAKEEKRSSLVESTAKAIRAAGGPGSSIEELASVLGISTKAARDRVRNFSPFSVTAGIISKRKPTQNGAAS